MKACIIQPDGTKHWIADNENVDAFFYLDDNNQEVGSKHFAIAFHFRKGKPVLIIDKRNAPEVEVLIHEDSNPKYFIKPVIEGKPETDVEKITDPTTFMETFWDRSK